MQNGKNPNVQQKRILKSLKLDPENWLIVKTHSATKQYEIRHKVSNNTRLIPCEVKTK